MEVIKAPPGIIQITGERDVGKTTMALECGAPPERICFFDDDLKGKATVTEMAEAGIKLGAYHDLVALGRGKNDLKFHQAMMELIGGIKAGQFDAIIFDTWSRIAGSMHPYVLAHPKEFRTAYSSKGDIKGGQQWLDTHQLEAEALGHLAELARTVILVTHLRDHRIEGIKTGKHEPWSSKTLEKVCRLRVWLRPNPNSPMPIALVLKRLDLKVKDDDTGALRTVSVLPRRIKPQPGDRSMWDAVGRYLRDPVGLRELRPDEQPDDYELSLLEGTLTEEQRRMFQQMLDAGIVGGREEIEAEPDWETIKARAAEVKGPPAVVARTLSDEFGIEVSVAQAARWRHSDG